MIRKTLCIIAFASTGLIWAGKNDLAPLSLEEQAQFDGLVMRENAGNVLPYIEYQIFQRLAPRAANDVLNGVALAKDLRVGEPLTQAEYAGLYALCGHVYMSRDLGVCLEPEIEGTLMRLSQRLVSNYRKSPVLHQSNGQPLSVDDETAMYRLIDAHRHGTPVAADDEKKLVDFVERMLLNFEHAGLKRSALTRAVGSAWELLKTHGGYIRDGFLGDDAGPSEGTK